MRGAEGAPSAPRAAQLMRQGFQEPWAARAARHPLGATRDGLAAAWPSMAAALTA